MKKLTCEMCGSSDFAKQDGYFVCQSCGIKYSIEEAKKMMIEGTVSVEGTVDVQGTVKVDNTSSIDNYLKIAETAYESKNHAEAEKYANRIIEIDPDNYKAWLIKGKAAGWQSTLSNPRFPECISCFTVATEKAPQNEKAKLINDVKLEIKNISIALIALRAERFIKWPDGEEASGFLSDASTIVKTITEFLKKGIAINPSVIMAPIANLINQSVANAIENTISPDYKSKKNPYPTDADWKKYVIRMDFCISLVEQSINLSDDDIESDIMRYDSLIKMQEDVIDSFSYDWHYPSVSLREAEQASFWKSRGYDVDVYNNRVYMKHLSLSDEAIANRRKIINEYKKAKSKSQAFLSKKRQSEKNARVEKFWKKYPEEKEILLRERAKAEEKLRHFKSTNTGHTQTKLLKSYLEKIKHLLTVDRGETAKLTKKDNEFLESIDSFWTGLDSKNEYDEYLDKYPILKEASAVANHRKDLTDQLLHIEELKEERKNGNIAIITTIAFVLGFLFCIITPVFDGLEDYVGLFVFLGAIIIIAAPIVFVMTGLKFASNEASYENITKLENSLKLAIDEYNKKIDEMLAVPAFEGNVDTFVKIDIPEKFSYEN